MTNPSGRSGGLRPAGPPGRARRRLVIVAALTGGLLVAAWAGAWALVGPGVPAGTVVAGVRIGGLSPQQATELVAQRLAPHARAPIVLTAAGQPVRIDPQEAGLRLDAASTVAQAGGRGLDPVMLARAVRLTVSGRELEPVARVDEQALAEAARVAARRLSRPAVPGGVDFEVVEDRAVAVPHAPRPGARVLPATVRDRLLAGYLRRTRIQVPAVRTPAAVGAAEVARAHRQVAAPAVAAPIRLDTRDGSVPVPAPTLAAALTMRPEGHRLALHVDARALRAALAGRLQRPARDAAIRFVDGRPRVVPARRGYRPEDAALTRAVRAALASPTRTATLPLVRVEPRRTTLQVRRLGVVEEVSSFTTYFPYAPYRNINIGRAAELVDGTLLAPGDTFSLNRVVGERTRANGFTEGFIIRNGRFELDLGGGVSQLATTTYNAAFFAGLRDVEHHPHSLYISRYPVGREATVAWPTLDLRFTNDTPYGVAIHAVVQPGSPARAGVVTVSMWSTRNREVATTTSPRYRYRAYPTVHDPGPTCSPEGGVGGFDVDVTRVVSAAGRVLHREVDHVRYQPTPRVVCGPVPTPSVRPTPAGGATPPTTGPATGPTPPPTTGPTRLPTTVPISNSTYGASRPASPPAR